MAQTISDRFLIQVDSNTKGIKDARREIDLLIKEFVGLANVSSVATVNKQLKTFAKEAGIAKATVESFTSAIRRVGTTQPKLIKLQAEFDADRALRELQAKIDATTSIRLAVQSGRTEAPATELAKRGFETISRSGDLNFQLRLQNKILGILNEQIAAEVRLGKQAGKVTKEEAARVNKLLQSAQLIKSSVNLGAVSKSSNITQEQKSLVTSTQTTNEAIRRQVDQFNQLGRVTDQAKGKTKAFEKSQTTLSNTIGGAVVKIIKYRVAFVTMRAAIEALQSSIKTFSDLQLEIARLEKVVDPLTSDMKALEAAAFSLSRQFATTASEVLKSFTIFAQTGLKQEEVIKATQAALVGMVAVGLDAKAVTDALTAVIFTYNLAVEESINVLSKWIAVQAQFPITAQDLANSLKIVGAAAKVVGVDLDDLAGAVAAIGAITRKSGTAIGQSLKTIFARLPKKETIRAFEDIGIAVFKSADEFRDFDDILKDLSLQWPILDDATKTNIATTLGGIRRYADFVALMDNFAVKQQATIVSQQASTEAIRAGNLELITFSKTLDKARAIFGELAFVVGGQLAKPINFVVTALNKIFNAIGGRGLKVIASLITGFTIFTTSILAFIAVGKIWSALNAAIIFQLARLSGIELPKGVVSWGAYSTAVVAAGSANGVFAVSLSAVRAALGPIALILGAIGAAVIASFAIFGDETKNVSNAVEELTGQLEAETKALKKANEGLSEQPKVFADTIKTLRDYRDVLRETSKESEKYGEITAKINIILNGIKRTTPELVQVTADLKRSNDLATESFNDLESAMSNVSEANLKLIEGNKAEIAANIAKLEFKLAIARESEDEIKNQVRQIQRVIASADLNLDLTVNGKDVSLAEIFDQSISGAASDEISKSIALQLNLLGKIKRKEEEIDTARKGKRGFASPDLLNAKKELEKNLAPTFVGVFDSFIKEAENKSTLLRNAFFKEIEEDSALGKSFSLTFSEIESTIRRFSSKGAQLLSDIADPTKQRELNANLIEFNNLLVDGSFVLDNYGEKILGVLTRDTDLAASKVTKLESSITNIGKALSVDDRGQGVIFGKAIDDEINDLQAKTRELKKDIDKFFTGDELTRAQGLLEGFESLNRFEFDQDNINSLIKGSRKLGDTFKDSANEIQLQIGIINKALKLDTDQARIDLVKTNAELSKFLKLEEGVENQLSKERLGRGAKTLKDNFDLVNKEIKTTKDLAFGLLFIFASQNEILKREKRLVSSLQAEQRIQVASLKLQNVLAEDQLKLRKRTLDNESDLAKNRLQLAEAEFKNRIDILNLIDEAEGTGATQERRLAAANNLLKQQAKILETEIKAKAELALKPLIEGVEAFKSALSSGIGDIPDIVASGVEKRRDLEDDIRDIELDIQEARRDGDQQAIADAEHRKLVTQDELDTYRTGLFEISQVFDKIFGSISSAFWKKITDDFVESISNLSIGGVSIGEEFGQIFAKVGTEFNSDYESIVKKLNDQYTTEVRRINNEFLTRYADINNTTVSLIGAAGLQGGVTLPGGTFLPREAFQDDSATKSNTDAINKLSNGQKALISAMNLAAATIGQALFGGSRAGGLGSQVGGLFGAASLEGILGKSAFASLNAFGGPLGTLAGTLAGGLIGKFLGGDDKNREKPVIQALDSNTEAILGNTLALKQLDQAIFNAPTGFNIPFGGGGGSFGRQISVTINANDANAQDVANEVANIINGNFDEDTLAFGTRVSVAI